MFELITLHKISIVTPFIMNKNPDSTNPCKMRTLFDAHVKVTRSSLTIDVNYSCFLLSRSTSFSNRTVVLSICRITLVHIMFDTRAQSFLCYDSVSKWGGWNYVCCTNIMWFFEVIIRNFFEEIGSLRPISSIRHFLVFLCAADVTAVKICVIWISPFQL